MLIIALILAVAIIFGLLWLIYQIHINFAQKEQELLEKLHLENEEKEKILKASAKAIEYCIRYNKECIESHTRTLQALRSKHTKAIDMAIERNTLNERSRKRLEKKFEILENEILNEIETTKISEVTAHKLLEKAKQYLR